MMKYLFSILTTIILYSSCTLNNIDQSDSNDYWSKYLSEEVTVEGIAYNSKLGAFVAVNQEEPLWIESFHNWPLGYYGKRVVVTGIVIIKHDLLVFIQKEAEPQVTGVPVAEGTDLHLKRKRYLLKNATWNLIE